MGSDLEVLKIKPGITGPSQIKYLNEENMLNGYSLERDYRMIMKDKIKTDIAYFRNCSLLSDIKIVIRTINVLFKECHRL